MVWESGLSKLPKPLGHCEVVRAPGIEPGTPAWKAGVLPLNYARVCEASTF